jgi:hypothetical protein
MNSIPLEGGLLGLKRFWLKHMPKTEAKVVSFVIYFVYRGKNFS